MATDIRPAPKDVWGRLTVMERKIILAAIKNTTSTIRAVLFENMKLSDHNLF
jgi:hypothetical protein